MDNLDEVKEIGTNEFTLRELVEQLKTTMGVLPFVGAGLSIPFGFKGWQQFLLFQANYAGIENKIRQRIDKGEYEEAAQDLSKALKYRAFQDALLNEYGDYKLNGIRVQGAVSFLPRLASGPVITTNFDHVLERIFKDSGAPFEDVVWGAKVQPALKAVQQNKRCLLKLHGDVADHTDRILTLSEFRKHYGSSVPSQINFKKPLPLLLQILLNQRPVLFLGCSLNHDRLVKLLKSVVQTNRDATHYAVVEYPGQRAFSGAQRYFSAHGIRPIWYPKGKHEFVELIVKYLSDEIGDSVPTGKRYQNRRNVISRGIKATEALDVLINQHADIESFYLVKYKDKLRLGERTGVRLPDNPELYLTQAAIHNDKDDELIEVSRTELNSEYWEGLFKKLQEGFVLAISSKVKLKDGKKVHIPMMDFKCVPSHEYINIAKDALRKIDQTDGVLLNSGKSFHYYGQMLMSEEQWHKFLGHSLLLSDLVDTRYIGHALINNECRLRISTTRLNPFIPTVVDVF